MQTSTMNVMEGEVFLIKSKPQTLCNKNRIDCMEWGVFYSQDSYILHRQMPVPRANMCNTHIDNKGWYIEWRKFTKLAVQKYK